MRLGNIASGAAFRLALFLTPVLILVLIATGAFILNVAESTMYDEVRAQLGEELLLLGDIHDKEGEDALTAVVNTLTRAYLPDQRLVGIFSDSGARLAGNVIQAPAFTGWSALEQASGPNLPLNQYFAAARQFDGETVVVGRAMRFVANTKAALTWAMVLAGMTIVIVVLAIGFVISLNTASKLATIDSTLEQVSRGNTTVRLPVGSSNDQIDRISQRINQHLDRLSTLMETTRNTIKAIAHDVKSPLNRAYLSLQQALGEQKNTRARNADMQRAITDLESVSSVFDTILRISRIEASSDQSNFTFFSARALLEDIAETYEPVIEEARQRFVCNFDGAKDVPIYGDRKMLVQLLANLIENAGRYAPKGAEIVLTLAERNGGALIEVADNGPGIPGDKIKDALRPFGRLKQNGHDEGAGLGLALVAAIATRHGASLSLTDNKPGLRVSVLFPAVPNIAPD